PSRTLDRLGLVAVLALVLGPLLAWLRLVPGIVGFATFALGGILALVVTILGVIRALRGRGYGGGVLVATLGLLAFVALAACPRAPAARRASPPSPPLSTTRGRSSGPPPIRPPRAATCRIRGPSPTCSGAAVAISRRCPCRTRRRRRSRWPSWWPPACRAGRS